MESRNTNEADTECVSPPALNDEELIAALDGDAPPPVRAHLEQCRFCAAGLEGMRMFEETLLSAMYRADCPTTEELTDYVLGSASRQVVRVMDDHLMRCKVCSEEVAALRAFFVTDEVKVVEEVVHEPVWQQVKDLFQTMGDQLVRVLSPQVMPAYGQRKGVSQKQVVAYSHEAVSVRLTLEQSGERFRIQGTILHKDAPNTWINGTVELASQANNQQRYLALIDDDENFMFKAVMAGRFNMNIYEAGGAVLRLKDIDISG